MQPGISVRALNGRHAAFVLLVRRLAFVLAYPARAHLRDADRDRTLCVIDIWAKVVKLAPELPRGFKSAVCLISACPFASASVLGRGAVCALCSGTVRRQRQDQPAGGRKILKLHPLARRHLNGFRSVRRNSITGFER